MKLTSKLSAVLLLSLLSQISWGQFTVEKKRRSYVGLTAGINYSFPTVTDHYSVLTSLTNTENDEKQYGKFSENMGVQFGIHYSYNFTNTISIVTGLGYRSEAFNYSTQYAWTDTMQSENFEREMHHFQKISYFTMPIMGKWDMTEGKFKPYVQAGIFMNYLHQANKEIRYDNVIDGEETSNQTTSTGAVSISDNIRKFNVGLMGGAGISYYFNSVTIGLEANYRYGFLKVVDDENRYADNNGFALKYLDVLDQLTLSSMNVELTVSAPIGHSFISKFVRRKRYNSFH
jgi:hypothetical protein